MGRKEALTKQREAVLDRWFQAVIGTYPEDTVKFLRREKDCFHNPVGHAVLTGIAQLYDGLVEERAAAELSPALDQIVRIRAVQEFTPSAAVGFVYAVKPILRAQIPAAELSPADWAALDAGVDRLALLAFDIYMQCREKIFEIRVREIKELQLLAARTCS